MGRLYWTTKIKDLTTEEVSLQYNLNLGPSLLFRYLLEKGSNTPVSLAAFRQYFRVPERTFFGWLRILRDKDLIIKKSYEISKIPKPK